MALDTIPKQEGGKLKAVASGTLPSGQPVVVNADGTVSVVAGSSLSEGVGSASIFESANSTYLDSAFDSTNNKFIVAYQDSGNSQRGTAVVGTVSGDSISFGTPVVFQSSTIEYCAVVHDSTNNKIVIFYHDVGSTNYGKAIVGTVSGTSISFGTAVVFASVVARSNFAAFDSGNGKVVNVYRNSSANSAGDAVVGTVSGTSISFGSSTNWSSANQGYGSVTYIGSSKFLIGYTGSSEAGTALVATLSGTSLSYGSSSEFRSQQTFDISSAYDSSTGKAVMVYRDNFSNGRAAVATISGTSVSFGSDTIFAANGVVASGDTSKTAISYDSTNDKMVISYQDNSNSNYGTIIVGTVSGTSISFGTPLVFEAASTNYTTSAFDTNSGKVVIAYRDQGNSNYGTSVVFQNANVTTNLTSENYIGMSKGFAESSSTSKGTSVVFESGRSSIIDSTFDSANNKIVISYCDNDNSSYGTAVVGTVSGTSISFGTPVVFKSATLQSPIKITYDSTKNRIVIVYKNASSGDDGEIIVGQVSGTSITFGSSVVFDSGLFASGDVVYDSNAQRILISYQDEVTSNNGFCCVVSIGGTGDLVPTVNSRQTFNAASTQYISSVYDSTNQKVVIVFRDNGDSNKAKAIVATVGSTSATFGSEAEFSASAIGDSAISFDSNSGKVVVAYKDDGNSGYGTAIVGTVSGTSISFGSATVFEEASTVSLSSAFDSNLNKAVISYRDTGNSDAGTLAVGTVSGTSISFDTPFVFESEVYNSTSVTFDSNSNKIVASFNDDDTNRIGTSAVITVGFDNRGQVASGGNATVDIVGTVSTNQSGLTAGQQYFVQTDGTLGLTAADPSVLAGTAISATKLIVKT